VVYRSMRAQLMFAAFMSAKSLFIPAALLPQYSANGRRAIPLPLEGTVDGPSAALCAGTDVQSPDGLDVEETLGTPPLRVATTRLTLSVTALHELKAVLPATTAMKATTISASVRANRESLLNYEVSPRNEY